MSGFGVNRTDGQLYTVDFTTGAWTIVGPPNLPAVPPAPSMLVYDCDQSQMFIMYEDGAANSNLYEMDTTTRALTLVGSVPLDNITGMAYDSFNNIMYGVTSTQNLTYTVDTSTNTWTPLANPISPGGTVIPFGLVYDCANDALYGLGLDTSVGPSVYRMYTVNRADGSWSATFTMSTGIASTNPHRGLVWDQSTGIFYGTILGTGQMYEIDIAGGTGSWTIPVGFGATGVSNPIAMAFERPCCCVHESSVVQLTNGQSVEISSIKDGDTIFDYQRKPIQIKKNICCGRASEFIKFEKDSLAKQTPSQDLLILSGHPILFQGQEIECQFLSQGKLIHQDKKSRVFTLVTEQRSFINIQGVMVGTWSQEAFNNFLQNDSKGKRLWLTYQ